MIMETLVPRGRLALPVMILALALASTELGARELRNPFFAMDTGTHDAVHKTPAEQVALVKQIGFDGVGPTYESAAVLQQWLAALDQNQLKMFALYLPLRLDDVSASLSSIKEAAAALSGRDTLLWIYITANSGRPFNSSDEAVAVQALRRVSAYAEAAGLRVALYPHAGFFVQRVEDAVRLASEVGRKNVGVTFNLCHWLMVDGKDLAATLKAARPYLLCVTLNGADVGGTSWDRLIQPLDRGTYDVSQLLVSLQKMRYTGPIGLQHYGIPGDARENLEHSMAGWKRLSGQN